MLRKIYHRCYSTMHKSKRRHSNVQYLSSHDCSEFSIFPPVSSSRYTSVKHNDSFFGESIQPCSPPFYKPQSDTIEGGKISTSNKSKWNFKKQTNYSMHKNIDLNSITSEIDEFRLNQSLSSSPSWSDDNDAECSKKVQDELEHMDRIFRGIDPIPLHYDVDEYKQWMEAFPNLSLFGKKETGPYKIWLGDFRSKDAGNKDIEILPKSKNLKHYKEEIKKAVILNIYENISIRLEKEPAPECSLKKTYHVGDANKTQIYLSDCLKESPFTQVIQDRYRRNSFNNKYDPIETDKTPRFESLPLVFEDSRDMESELKKDKSHTITARKSRKGIVLPHINGNNSNSFRSISATPTYSSLVSAKAMKLENKLLSGKSRDIKKL